MLRNFFKLNVPFETFDEHALEAHFRRSRDLRSVLYQPERWPDGLKKLKACSFNNVSLSKKFLYQLTFTDCCFEDCLFIGTSFTNVEFHRCKFINCNFYKVTFDECYLDPATISLDKSFRPGHSNIGVHLYQKLYDDCSKQRQSDFAMTADIEFRKWKRWQLKYDERAGKIGRVERIAKTVFSVVYEWLTGFGYRPWRFITATIVLFIIASLFNMAVLPERIKIDDHPVGNIGFADSVFYTFSILTVLGFSTIVPQTAFAKILAVTQALFGVGWLGLFTSLLVKRFIK